ncbi:MAG: DNA repair protein RecN [Actinobacteria bacterium]|nr:DNA repair protein RecN [Actinomycetota bacterium]
MLETIRIRDLGLISEAEIDFKPGFVAITGETGAGKTLLLDAVRILRGEKPSVVGVMPDANVTVDASVSIERDSLRKHISELGISVDDGFMLISRTFPSNGRAKTAIGGRPFPAATLEDLSSFWLAIHGQHDSLRLLKSQTHRELLDTFGGVDLNNVLTKFNGAYADWRSGIAELARLEKTRKELLANAESIKADLSVFDSLNVAEGDVAEIAQTVERVSRKEEFKSAISTALLAIQSDDSSVSGSLKLARQALERLNSDTGLSRIHNQLSSISNEIADLEVELNSELSRLESDGDDLDTLMMRQRQIKALLLRHGPDENSLIAWANTSRRQLTLIDPEGIELKKLQERVLENERVCREFANDLTEMRKVTADQFSEIVTREIRELAMPSAQFATDISKTEINEFGQDKVEFLFNANPGMKFQPIASAASGGELSRVMLALEVALLSANSPAVLIFDEVDAGVAGAAAISVGEKLTMLSKLSQVLVVTHLPQIAAFADQHINVSKASDGLVTQTTIRNLEDSERISEISRMLAGLEGSQSATAHAGELIQMAQDFKKKLK